MDRVNVEIKPEIWRKVGILAAILGKQKKQVVNEALRRFLDTYVSRFPPAPEETRPSKRLKRKENEHEEENRDAGSNHSGSGPCGSNGLGR